VKITFLKVSIFFIDKELILRFIIALNHVSQSPRILKSIRESSAEPNDDCSLFTYTTNPL